MYPRPRRRRGWGRVVVLAAALFLISGRLAYGSGPMTFDQVVVKPGDTVWTIAASHYDGDPRPHVEEIMAVNRLGSPVLTPGETLLLPRE